MIAMVATGPTAEASPPSPAVLSPAGQREHRRRSLQDNQAGGNCLLGPDTPGLIGAGNTAAGRNTCKRHRVALVLDTCASLGKIGRHMAQLLQGGRAL